MKKIIAFIIMVIVIILIIVLSYNYYNKKNNNKKLKDTSSELILHNRDKDKDKDENSSNSNNEANSNTNSNVPSTEAEDSGNVPNTASFGDAEFIPVDHVDINIAESVIKINQRTKIFVTFYPNNASDRTVFYSSNDKSVARVTSTGEVIGVGEGSTIIDVTVQENTYKVFVTVV